MQRTIPRILPWLFGAVALAASLTLPVGEGPDEFSHYQYAQWIARHGTPPPLLPQVAIIQRHQMPLWYLTLAPAMRGLGLDRTFLWLRRAVPGDPGAVPGQVFLHGADEVWPWSRDVLAFHILRLLSIPFGMLLVWVAWRAGAMLFPPRAGDPLPATVPFLAAAFVATQPVFTHLSGVVSNDPAAAGLAAAGLLLTARVLCRPEPGLPARAGVLRDAALAGALLGLGVSVKLSAAPLGAFAAGAVAVAAIVRRDRSLAWAAAVLAACVALLAGPYFLWNGIVRGDPLAHLAFEREHFHATTAFFAAVPARDYYLHLWTPAMFRSFFGGLGWVTVSPGATALSIDGVLLAAALVGLPLALHRGNRGMRLGTLAVLAACALEILPQAIYARRYGQPQGRHLFPILPAIGLVLALGWKGCLDWLPSRRARAGAGLLLVGLLACLDACTFLGPFRRAFGPRGKADEPWFAITDLDRTIPPLPGGIELAGAPADGAVVDPDGPPPVIRWRARSGASYGVQVATGDPTFTSPPYDFRNPVYRTYEVDGLVLKDHWVVPPRLLRLFPRGRAIHWRVVELVPARRIIDRPPARRPCSKTRSFQLRSPGEGAGGGGTHADTGGGAVPEDPQSGGKSPPGGL